MRHLQTLTATSLVALLTLTSAAAPRTAGAVEPFAVADARRDVDPVGSYTWWFDLGDGSKVTGTLKIARTAAGYSASITSDRTQGEGAARSVTVTGERVVVVLDSEHGEFTMDMMMKPDAITSTWKLVGNGGSQDGPMTVEREKK